MKVLAYRTGNENNGEIIEIKNELEPMQKFVGGYIEVVPMPNGLVIVCDEEGRLKNYPHSVDITVNNQTASFVGNVFVCGTDGEEFRGLSDDEIDNMRQLAQR